jgi:hypothetical protein
MLDQEGSIWLNELKAPIDMQELSTAMMHGVPQLKNKTQ